MIINSKHMTPHDAIQLNIYQAGLIVIEFYFMYDLPENEGLYMLKVTKYTSYHIIINCWLRPPNKHIRILINQTISDRK